MNLAINQLLKLFSLSIFCTALLFSAPVLSLDTDGDGIEDSKDADDDGDGVVDSRDAFPLDKKYSKDTDADGMPDAWETNNGLDPDNGNDATSDLNNDGLTAVAEFGYGTSPNRTDSGFDTWADG